MNIKIDQYQHKSIEKKWQEYWETNKTYKWDQACAREDSFVIDTPPPTVSGLLHMGHVFSYTQTDFIARYQRMKGKNVFYPMGFDDNGLPTERLVEKVKKIKAAGMSREDFRKLCEDVVAEAEKEFHSLFSTLGLSIDWSQLYKTIDDKCIAVSQTSFIDAFEKGLVYRSQEPSLWDPVDKTALAQADIEDVEHTGIMHDIVFEADSKKITIATTRPELLGACVAVLYHPEDERYTGLKGKKATVPIFGQQVPIIADEKVEISKGTGLVMCCTFGDIMDVEWWKRHKLETRIILDQYGKIRLENAHTQVDEIEGKKASEARLIIASKLKEMGLLTKETTITRPVKCAERSKAPIEIIMTPQWFIKVLDLKEQLLAKSAECNWHPHFMKHRLDNWINGLSWDWCISRQRYFGVPFPAWFSKRKGEEGKLLLAKKEQLPVNPLVDLPEGYSKDEVEPDVDVMDTWATSSVTPQINAQGINAETCADSDRYNKLFPADLRPQAHEIIRTWAFYTIVKSTIHENSIPWKNLMISGWVLAADKTKMSKSKGNVVTPIDLIEEKGVDVIRYWASSSRLGADIAYSEDVFKIGKKLITKLWNAAKFISTHLENTGVRKADLIKVSCSLDKWILIRLKQVVTKATAALEEFEYCVAREAIEDFFWNDFCDNYLELIKIRIYNDDNADAIGQASAANACCFVLETLLKLFAPFMPYVTEEIYQAIFGGKSIHTKGMWPNDKFIEHDKNIETLGKQVLAILEVARKFKTLHNLSMKAELSQVSVLCKDLLVDTVKDLQNAMGAQQVSYDKMPDATDISEHKIEEYDITVQIKR